MEELQIEVYADIACPWCYVGERRLERALAQRPELRVEWRWRPFQLQPDLPREGVPWEPFARAKFGGLERARMSFAHMRQVGEAEGIAFDFDRMTRAPNTADAHRLVLCARQHDLERAAADTLFRAYFSEGADVSDRDTLVRLGEQIGLDAQEVRGWLASEQGMEEVRRSQETAEQLGITGVPFYIFDGRFALSGAQPPEVFLRALDLASAEPARTSK